MHIKLRIVILFLMVMACIWYIDLPDKIHERNHLKKIIANLDNTKVLAYKNPPLILKDERTPEDIFDALLHVINAQGFQVDTLQWLKTHTLNGYKVTTIVLKVSGDFTKYFLLLNKIFQFDLPIDLQSFSIHVENAQTAIFMKCAIFHVKNFGFHAPVVVPLHLQNTPLHMLKWVGFMQASQNKWGLLALPNGQMFPVKVNDVIGKEKAKIIHISEHSLILMDGKLRKKL